MSEIENIRLAFGAFCDDYNKFEVDKLFIDIINFIEKQASQD